MHRVTTAVLATVVMGCAPGGDGAGVAPADKTSPRFGKLAVQMHDAPLNIDGHTVSSIYVTVAEVSIHGAGGWKTLTTQEHSYDLLDLTNNASALLAGAVLESGTYQQIKLRLAPESSIIVDGQNLPLFTPSAESDGVKLQGPFTVTGNTITTLVLDFDAQKSIKHNPKGWYLHPTISVDAVTSKENAFAATMITADDGGSVSLGDGATIELPPGALAEDTVISIERIQDSPGGFIFSPVYQFGPDGIQFNSPVSVTLPYVESALPSAIPESGLEMSVGFERVGVLSQDTTLNLLTGQTSHFTLLFITNKSGFSLPEIVVQPTEFKIYDHSEDYTPWVVAVIEPHNNNPSQPDVRVRGVLAPVADSAGAGTEDDVYALQNLQTLVSQDWINPLFAVNTTEWAPHGQGETQGTLVRTTRSEGVTKLNSSATEVLLRLFDAADGASAPFTIAPDTGAPLVDDDARGVFGSLTSVVWDGEFKRSSGAAHTNDNMPQFMKDVVPRTAVGLDADGRLVVLVAGGGIYNYPPACGMTARDVYNKLRDFGVVRGMLLDGGGSTQVLWGIEGAVKTVKNLMRGAYAVKYPSGRPIVSALVVEHTPEVTSVTPSPSPVKFGQSTQFNISGAFLPPTTVGFVPQCVGGTATQGGSFNRTFSCVPQFDPGKKTGVVKEYAGGVYLLKSFEVDVVP